MTFQIQFLITVVSLIAGMIAIYLSNRTMRKYRVPYLSTYFYFLIFFYIFAVYSIIGSHLIIRILQNQQIDVITLQSAQAILIALGIPFLILSLYMFLRFSHELYKVEIPKLLSLLYFVFFAISFLGYGLLNLDLGGIEVLRQFLNREQLIWSFSILMLVIPGYGISYILIRSKQIKDANKRKAYLWISIWYTVFILTTLACLHLTRVSEYFGLIFISLLTGFHLVPVLFLNLYLQRHYIERVESADFSNKLEKVVSKYEISKRESEIVVLICKGMSNQEISDSLFISLQTVKDHVHRIFNKTGVKNRVQLTNLVTSEKTN